MVNGFLTRFAGSVHTHKNIYVISKIYHDSHDKSEVRSVCVRVSCCLMHLLKTIHCRNLSLNLFLDGMKYGPETVSLYYGTCKG